MLEIVSALAPVFLSVTVCVADVEPTLVEVKVRLVGERLTAGAPAPVPLRATVCGEFGALSLKLSVAVKVPAAVGLKVNVTTQEAPTANVPLPTHDVAPWKSEPLVPVIVGLLVKVRVAVPVFLIVTVCEADAAPTAVDGKVRLVGETVAAMVVGAAPVPLMATVCGELGALSTKLSAPVSEPVVVGLKVTVTVQEALPARDEPQLLVWENEEALVPVMLMPEMVMEAVPPFVSVTACEADEELTAVDGKARLVDDKLADGVDVAPGQFFTTFATLSDPRPVALS